MKLLSPATTLSITLSLRDSKIKAEMTINMTPKIVLTIAESGLPLIFALTTLSKFSLISPIIASLKSSYSSSLSSSSSVFGVFIIKSSSIGFSSKLKASESSSPGW